MRTFVDCLIDNGEKVASSKIIPNRKTRVQKPYPIYGQNCQNRYPIYMYLRTNWPENHRSRVAHRQTDRQTDRHVYLESYTKDSTSTTISKIIKIKSIK